VTLRERVTLHTTAAAVTALLWAPLAIPGYVLAYDMVFVPRQHLRWDLVAPTASLPRAVPQDAVVSALSLIAPGWLLQRVVLLATIYLAVLGAARLVPAQRLLTRMAAGVLYAWAPFFAERLLLGQWGLLIAYAALPWLVRAAIGLREGRPGALPRLVLAAAPCAITPTGGFIALAVTIALAPMGRERWRDAGLAVGAVFALNAPWLAAAALTTAGGRTDPAGVAAFAIRGENWSGPLGAVLGTGGVWNAQTMPASRASALVPLVTAALVALAVLGFAPVRRRWPASTAVRLGVVALVGLLIALAGAIPLTADGLRWLVANVPGTGLLRDGQKFLMPYALLLALCAAAGAERLADRLAEGRARAVLVAAALLPIAALPDLAFGGAGRLQPVRYPGDWDAVARAVAASPGETVSVPFRLYRRYEWNADRTVIDPAPRYLPAEVLVDDTLQVGPIVVAGEGPRAAMIRRLLAEERPLARAGVPWVLVQHNSREIVPSAVLEGLVPVYEGPYLALYRNPSAPVGPRPFAAGPARVILIIHLLAVVLIAAALVYLPRRRTAW
jgi:hypothetical protein